MRLSKRQIKVLSVLVILLIVAGYLYRSNLGLKAAAVPAYVPAAIDKSGMKAVTVKTHPELPNMEALMESEELQFFMNRTTAEFAVVDKRNGHIWFSNPQDRDKDTVAAGANKGKLAAQMSLVYLNKSGHKKDYNSFSDSIQHQTFEIASNDEGVIVTYQFGNPERGLEVIPVKISKARLEEKVLSKLDEKDRQSVATRFKLDEAGEMYDRRPIPSKAVERQLIALFDKAGYTEADLAVDNGGAEGAAVESENPKFTVALHYALDGDQLVASVDTASIEDSGTNRIQSIALLENFGAGGLQDEGYLFIPDGTGSIIRFNNGRGGGPDGKAAQPILLQMYGPDSAIYEHYRYANYLPSRMPVFGIKKNDSALLAMIEEGDALARITADVSGRLNQYNMVSSNFVILPSDEVRLSSDESTIKMAKKRHIGPLQIRYSFLYGDQANYSGMAGVYRDYLVKKYDLKKIPAEGDTPFYLELAGNIEKDKTLAGIPYKAQVPLSPLDRTKELLAELSGDGIRNVQLNYKGWFNNGVNHDIPTKVEFDRVVGTPGEWRELQDQLAKGGGQMYPDVAFMRVYGGKINPAKDAILHISRRIGAFYTFDPATYWKDWWRFTHHALSPAVVPTVVSDFLDEYEAYNPGAISLRDLGEDVYSDFRSSREVTRETAKHIITGQLARIHEQAPKVMVSGGNEYALRYASHIVNAPEESNRFQLTDESVPFYQMALHGYVEFTGKPFNLKDDQDVRKNVLKSLETGSNVFYSWVLQDAPVLKTSMYYGGMYSADYQLWLEEAKQVYSEVNAVLKQVKGQAIVRHEQLAEGVYKTAYENGKAVIVNYNLQPATVDGMTIEAGNFKVMG